MNNETSINIDELSRRFAAVFQIGEQHAAVVVDYAADGINTMEVYGMKLHGRTRNERLTEIDGLLSVIEGRYP